MQAPVKAGDAKKDAETAGEALRTLIKLFLRNGELRKLFNDLAFIGRDMFADAASKTAELARPDDEKLQQVDQPAPENEFHDDIPVALRKAEKAKDQAKDLAGQAQDAASQAQGEASQHVDANASAQTNAANVADQAAKKLEQENLIDRNAPLKQNVDNVASKLKATTIDKIPEKHKEVLKEKAEQTQDYLKEKFPKERRDQFIYRLKKVVVECQRHREYQEAMDFFLTAFENYKGHTVSVAKQVESSAVGVRTEGNVQTAEHTFRTLIERFANGRPTQPVLDALDQIYTDVKNDPELKNWFTSVNKYLRACLKTPGYIMKDESDQQARNLVESGKKFFVAADGREQGKYVPHKDKLFDEIETFFKGMAEDPLNKKFGDDWKRLVQDLFLDASGKPTFKPALWRDIQNPILPELAKHIGYVPIPRIEYTDKMVDLTIENLTLEAQNLMPNVVTIENHNYVKFSAYKNIRDVNRHSLAITLSGIQSDLRDIHFAIKKKTGFPKLSDKGTADVFVGGKGLEVHVDVELENIQGRARRHVFTVKNVKCNIDTLNFAVHHTSKDLLVKILKPLATGLIKKQIKKAIETAIREALERADVELVDLLNQLDAAKKSDKTSQIDVLKAKLSKEDKPASKSDGTLKIVTSKRDSILPNMGDKDGWVNQLDKRIALAKAQEKGKADWHSPAFTIVSPGQKDPKHVGNLPRPLTRRSSPAARTSPAPTVTSSAPAATSAPPPAAAPESLFKYGWIFRYPHLYIPKKEHTRLIPTSF